MFALGIRFVGETVAKKLAKHFKSIDNFFDYYFGSKVVHAPKGFDKDNETSNQLSIDEEYDWIWYKKDKPCQEDGVEAKYCLVLREQCSDITISEKEKFNECVYSVRKELGYKIWLDPNKIMKEFDSDKD